MFQSIDHVNIVVRDLQAAKAFFTDCGFTIQHEGDLQGHWISKIVGLDDVRAEYAKLTLPGFLFGPLP